MQWNPGFENKDQRSFSYSAMCVPSDVCSVDVAGATKGLKVPVGTGGDRGIVASPWLRKVKNGEFIGY